MKGAGAQPLEEVGAPCCLGGCCCCQEPLSLPEQCWTRPHAGCSVGVWQSVAAGPRGRSSASASAEQARATRGGSRKPWAVTVVGAHLPGVEVHPFHSPSVRPPHVPCSALAALVVLVGWQMGPHRGQVPGRTFVTHAAEAFVWLHAMLYAKVGLEANNLIV